MVLNPDADDSDDDNDNGDGRYGYYDAKKKDDGHHPIAERDRKTPRLGMEGLDTDDRDNDHDDDDHDEDWTLL